MNTVINKGATICDKGIWPAMIYSSPWYAAEKDEIRRAVASVGMIT